MGQNSKIAWTDHTFNPWIGCAHVNELCDNCYAESLSNFHGWANWGRGETRHRTSPENWRKPLHWNREAVRRGIRYRVFCASLADVFDTEVPTLWRSELFELIRETPSLDWILLTKRPAQMRDYLNRLVDAPWPNVWALVSAATQRSADAFLPILVQTNTIVRGVSCEPFLEWTDFSPWLSDLQWLIAGDESGPRARPSKMDWYRQLRDQCQAAGVPFFLKQFCDRRGRKTETPELDGQRWVEYPSKSLICQ